jgi:hypothetical protein
MSGNSESNHDFGNFCNNWLNLWNLYESFFIKGLDKVDKIQVFC